MASLSDNTTSSSMQVYPIGNSSVHTDLASMKTNQLVQHDLNQQENMKSILIGLSQSMKFCEKLVISAYSLANYIPPVTNIEQQRIWNDNVSVSYSYSLRNSHLKAISFVLVKVRVYHSLSRISE